MSFTLLDEEPPKSAKPKKGGFVLLDENDPTEGMSGTQKFLAGTGKAFVDIARGAKQLVGLGDQKEIDDAKERDAPLMRTGAGLAGNVTGNVAASLLPAGAAGVAMRGAAAIPALSGAMQAGNAAAAAHPLLAAALPGVTSGALMGAVEPVATGESRAKNIALSAGIGAAGAALPRAVASVVKPNIADDATKLIKEGVQLTPGQALGGAWKATEEKLTSVPVLGDMIKRAQTRGIEDFDRAAFNRALAPIGEKVGKDFNVGREGIAEVEKKIGSAYDKALNNIKIVDFGPTQFGPEVNKIMQMADELGDDAKKQLIAVVKNRVVDRMTPAGTMSADTMKIVEADLGMFARKLAGSADSNQRGLGAAIREVQASLRRAVETSAGPDAAAQLQAANKAWSEFVRVQDAAGRIGAKEGVFTPAQYLSAVRSQDKSVRKGAFARGDAVGQDLGDAGKNTLAQTVPDSGSIGRGLAVGAPAGMFLPPELLALGGAAMLPYTGFGGKMTLAMLAKRPQQAAQLAELLRAGSPASGLVAAGMGLPSLSGP